MDHVTLQIYYVFRKMLTDLLLTCRNYREHFLSENRLRFRFKVGSTDFSFRNPIGHLGRLIGSCRSEFLIYFQLFFENLIKSITLLRSKVLRHSRLIW